MPAGLGTLRTRRFGLHAWRNGLHLLGQACWVYALSALPLATVFAIEFTSPIWTALFAATFLGERITAMRLLAIALGFLGERRPNLGGLFALDPLNAVRRDLGLAPVSTSR